MSGDAITAWRTFITPQLVKEAQDSMPEKRRPDARTLELVGVYLVQSFIDSRGFAEETQLQIKEGLHEVVSIDQIRNALQAWQNAGVMIVVSKGTKGRATRRVFSFHDPKNLANRNGVDPVTKSDTHNGVEVDLERGSDEPQRDSDEPQRANPFTPEQLPERNLNPHLTPAQIADKVARIALELDQERNGKINTTSLQRQRTFDYKTSVVAFLREQPNAEIDPWGLALQLVEQRANPHPRRATDTAAPPTRPKEKWENATPDCPTCEGRGMVRDFDETTNQWGDNKLCHCCADYTPLEQRIENDQALKRVTRDLLNTFKA